MRSLADQIRGGVHAVIIRQGECGATKKDKLDGEKYCSSGTNNGNYHDTYSARNILSMTGAIENTKKIYGADIVVGVGSSGGAQYALIGSTMNHGLFNATILNGLPCNMTVWRQIIHGGERWSTWPQSLDADALAAQADPKSDITFSAGLSDTNTPRLLTEKCEAAYRPYVARTEILDTPWGHGIYSEDQEKHKAYAKMFQDIIADVAKRAVEKWKSEKQQGRRQAAVQ